jgi:hypothetical protein
VAQAGELPQNKNQLPLLEQGAATSAPEGMKQKFFEFVGQSRDTLKRFKLNPQQMKALFIASVLGISSPMLNASSIAKGGFQEINTPKAKLEQLRQTTTPEKSKDTLYSGLNTSPESKEMAQTIAEMGHKEAENGSSYGKTNPESEKGQADNGLVNQGFCHPHIADVLDALNELKLSSLKHSMNDGWKSDNPKVDPNADPVQFQPFLEKEIQSGQANWHRVNMGEVNNPNELQGMMMIIQPNEQTRAEGWTHHLTAGHIVILQVDQKTGEISGYSDGEMNFKLDRMKANDKNLSLYQINDPASASVAQQVAQQAASAPSIGG